MGVVTLVAGVGVDWLSTSLFSTPAKVRLAITPATGLGYTVASLLSDVGIGVSHRGLEGAVGVVAFGITAVTGAVLLYRVRVGRLVPWLGAFLVIAAAGGPAAWPWYFIWGLALLSLRCGRRSTPPAWRSRSRCRCSWSSPTGSWRCPSSPRPRS